MSDNNGQCNGSVPRDETRAGSAPLAEPWQPRVLDPPQTPTPRLVEMQPNEGVAPGIQSDPEARPKTHRKRPRAEPQPGVCLSARPDREELLSRMPPAIVEEARPILFGPSLLRRISDDIGACGVAGERKLKITLYLTGVSRLLNEPLAVIVGGASSTGKSLALERVASLFPQEAVVLTTQMTPQAMFYMPRDALVHRFVVAGERSRRPDNQVAETTRALREMLSAGRLTKMVTMQRDGVYQTECVEVNGPIAYAESTTVTRIFEEDANRCLLLSTDERPAQTRRVLRHVAHAYIGRSPGVDRSHVVLVHHAMQRLIEPLPVVVPFARRLAGMIDDANIQMRRAFPQLLRMVQACALLHQFQRERDAEGCVVASAADYRVARALLENPLSKSLRGRLSPSAQRFFERLQTLAGGSSSFSTRQAVDFDRAGGSERAVRGWLTDLKEAGVIEQLSEGHGNSPATWRLPQDAAERVRQAICPLPTVEQLFGRRENRRAGSG